MIASGLITSGMYPSKCHNKSALHIRHSIFDTPHSSHHDLQTLPGYISVCSSQPIPVGAPTQGMRVGSPSFSKILDNLTYLSIQNHTVHVNFGCHLQVDEILASCDKQLIKFLPYTDVCIALYTQCFPGVCGKKLHRRLRRDSNPRPPAY